MPYLPTTITTRLVCLASAFPRIALILLRLESQFLSTPLHNVPSAMPMAKNAPMGRELQRGYDMQLLAQQTGSRI